MKMSDSDSANAFALNVNDAHFQQRQKDVFDQLAVLEKNRTHNNMDVDESEYSEVANSGNNEKKVERAYAKNFRGRESIFKRPQDSKITRNFMRRMPDFKKNPHKWTKYSLDDVKDEDISEKGNTRAALSFLKEIETRKKQISDIDHDEDDKPKIIFRRAIEPRPETITKQDTPEDKPSFASSKVIMPEYVIGQKTKKEKTKKGKVDKGKELKLDHLYEEDE